MIGRWTSVFVAWAALFFVVASDARAATRFTFKIPAGWTDLSPGAPESAFAGMAPEVVTEAKSGKYAAYAINLGHADPNFAENFNAIVGKGSEPITQTLVEQWANALSGEMAKQSGGSATVLEKTVLEIAGVHCGRLVSEFHIRGIDTRAMTYIMPGDSEHVVLTYSASPSSFESLRPTFDDAAAGTGGLVEPSGFWGRIFGAGVSGGMRGAIVGGLVGAIVGIVAWIRRKKSA